MTEEQIKLHQALGILFDAVKDEKNEKKELIVFHCSFLEGAGDLNIPCNVFYDMTSEKLSEVIADWLAWGFTLKLKEAMLALQEEDNGGEEGREAEATATDPE
jgi:hypothetical protein